MKIDGSNPFSEAPASALRRAAASNGTGFREIYEAMDSTGPSPLTGKSVGILVAKLKEMPDVRQDRVAALRQAIQSGQYRASDQQIADAVHAQFFGFSSGSHA